MKKTKTPQKTPTKPHISPATNTTSVFDHCTLCVDSVKVILEGESIAIAKLTLAEHACKDEEYDEAFFLVPGERPSSGLSCGMCRKVFNRGEKLTSLYNKRSQRY